MSLINVNAMEPSTGTDITLGASGDTTTVPSGATLTVSGTMNASSITAGTLAVARGGTGTTSYTAGITVADQWRLTSNFTGDANPIAANLEQIDTTGQGTIGSAMTESSGIFTFPSTGIYWVKFNVQYYMDQDARFMECAIYVASTKVAQEYTFIDNGGEGGNTYAYVSCDSLVDCDDTSVDTVKFTVSSSNPTYAVCSSDTDKNTTSMTFIRLGDT